MVQVFVCPQKKKEEEEEEETALSFSTHLCPLVLGTESCARMIMRSAVSVYIAA